MSLRSICILSLSPIADDPRVRRQGDAFADAGWSVTAVGLPGGRSPPPRWPILTPAGSALAPSRPLGSAKGALAALPRPLQVPVRVGWRAALGVAQLPGIARQIGFRFMPSGAVRYYLERPHIAPLLAAAREVRATVYLANDWHMLPVAMALATAHDGIVGYDTHEYALEEYGHRPWWRLTRVPLVRAVETEGLSRAAVRTCVSAGIGEDIARVYGLSEPLVEIRNVPDRHEASFKPTGERISVLFHGILAPNRGIEECLASVPLWRPEYSFILRGPAEPAYRISLDHMIRRLGIGARVVIEPPVPMVELVTRATTADIGIVTLPPSSKHNLFALPNKFFEYVQAGLALIVSDLPDMARLVTERGFGVLVQRLTPDALAAAVNGLDRARIDALKRKSLEAAVDLNWQAEQRRLVSLYEAALARPYRMRAPGAPAAGT